MNLTSHAGTDDGDGSNPTCEGSSTSGDTDGTCWGTKATLVGGSSWTTTTMTFEYKFSSSGQLVFNVYNTGDNTQISSSTISNFFKKDGHTFDLATTNGVPILIGINNTSLPGANYDPTTGNYWDVTNLCGENISVTTNTHGGTEGGTNGYVTLIADPDATTYPCCKAGIASDGACCASSCGTCGGPNCGDLPGGGDNCCGSVIKDKGITCVSEDDVACIIPDDNVCSASCCKGYKS